MYHPDSSCTCQVLRFYIETLGQPVGLPCHSSLTGSAHAMLAAPCHTVLPASHDLVSPLPASGGLACHLSTTHAQQAGAAPPACRGVINSVATGSLLPAGRRVRGRVFVRSLLWLGTTSDGFDTEPSTTPNTRVQPTLLTQGGGHCVWVASPAPLAGAVLDGDILRLGLGTEGGRKREAQRWLSDCQVGVNVATRCQPPTDHQGNATTTQSSPCLDSDLGPHAPIGALWLAGAAFLSALAPADPRVISPANDRRAHRQHPLATGRLHNKDRMFNL